MSSRRILRFEAFEPRIAMTAQPLVGDLTRDGAVDIFDVAAVSNAWGASGAAARPGDADGNNVVDLFDVALVSNQWGKIAPEIPTGGYERLLAPPAGFSSALMWMEAIQDLDNPETGVIEVEWMKLLALVDGQVVTISDDQFDEPLGWTPGGLYLRDPWYGIGTPWLNHEWPMEVEWSGGKMIIRLEQTNRIYHWWTPERPLLPAGVDRMWAEARVRISGGAMVGAGIDYWRTPDAQWAGTEVNNREAGGTGWYTAWDGWQTISILLPPGV